MQAAQDSRLSLMIVLVGLVGSMSGLLIGYCTAVIAPALEFISRDFGLGVFLQGVAVASVLLGGFVGALLAGGFIRRLGERPTLFITGLLFIVGSFRLGVVRFLRAVAGLAHRHRPGRRRGDDGRSALCQ